MSKAGLYGRKLYDAEINLIASIPRTYQQRVFLRNFYQYCHPLGMVIVDLIERTDGIWLAELKTVIGSYYYWTEHQFSTRPSERQLARRCNTLLKQQKK